MIMLQRIAGMRLQEPAMEHDGLVVVLRRRPDVSGVLFGATCTLEDGPRGQAVDDCLVPNHL
jgi:hypothetical protein